MYGDDDPNHPANIRNMIRDERAQSVARNIDRAPAPQRAPRDVREDFRRAGLRGPDASGRT